MKKHLVLGLVILSLAMGTTACAKNLGNTALDFTLKDLNGNDVNLNTLLAERCVLLDFFATWCPPCLKGAPHVQELYEKYKDRISVLGINVGESKKTVSNFTKRTALTYPMLLDVDGRIAKEYGVVGIPTIVLIDKDKKILYFGHSVHEAEKHLPE